MSTKLTSSSNDSSEDEILTGHQPEKPFGIDPKTTPNNRVDALFRVALIEPDIPQNTGNIGRTCVGTKTELHLVGNLGFKITDRNLKRAGLDYWQYLVWQHHQSFDQWMAQIEKPERVFYFSTKGTKSYFEVDFQPGDYFVFGKETKGLDEDLLRRNSDRVLKIPLYGPIRSLNVATSVTVVLYEALRQLESRGHRLRSP